MFVPDALRKNLMLYQSLRRASLASSLLAGLAPWAVPAARADVPITLVHSFDGTYKGVPAGLAVGSNGALFGTGSASGSGGPNKNGLIYTVRPDGSGFQVLYFFSTPDGSNHNPDGYAPVGTLAPGGDGSVYGVTSGGGANGGGVVYRRGGDGTFQTLHSFAAPGTSGGDGSVPGDGLIVSGDGSLYGTTGEGGTGGVGTVFRLHADGSGYQVLHDFSFPTSGAVNADGSQPNAGLTDGGDGFLYGVTQFGGANGDGVAFRLRPDGTNFQTLHSFTTGDGNLLSALARGADGRFYGVTRYGGANGTGEAFGLDADGGNFAVLHAFSTVSSGNVNADGALPFGPLTVGTDGDLYGTTYRGGTVGNGTIFRLQPGGALETLASFNEANGLAPSGNLVQTGGQFYGTTISGGQGYGTVFSFPASANQAHLLWSNPDGKAAFWNVDGGGNVIGVTGYGPYTDSGGGLWHATSLATGPDGVSHILWNSAGGQVALWNVTNDGAAIVLAGFGPYTDGSPQNLWRAAGLSVGPDNLMHLLWTNPDHRAAFWNVGADGTPAVLAGYGPYLDGSSPWDAAGMSTGPDNVSHLLWTNPDGQAAFWDVSDADGSASVLAGYGPFTDGAAQNLWGAVGISTGPDNVSHLLWDNADGKAAFWAVSSGNGSIGGVTGYGPFTDGDGPLWAATGLTTGPDNVSRLLWNNSDGKVALWTLGASGTPATVTGYGPFVDGSPSNLWSAVGVSAGP